MTATARGCGPAGGGCGDGHGHATGGCGGPSPEAPPEALEVIRRHVYWRHVRCHMAGHCMEDAWLEDDGQTAYVVYGVHPVRGDASQVGFVVDLRTRQITSARLMVNVPDGIHALPIETLPLCPEVGQPYTGPGSEKYRRVPAHVLAEHEEHVH